MDSRLRRLLSDAAKGDDAALVEVAALLRRHNIGRAETGWERAVDLIALGRWGEVEALASREVAAGHVLDGFLLDALGRWAAEGHGVRRASAPRQQTRYRLENGWSLDVRSVSGQGVVISDVISPDGVHLLRGRSAEADPRRHHIGLVSSGGEILKRSIFEWLKLRVRPRDLGDEVADLFRLPGELADLAESRARSIRRRRRRRDD